MIGAIAGRFVPVKFHIKEQPAMFDRFEVHWTPTQVVLDADGEERDRIEGFLPVDDFIARLEVALGRTAFDRADYAEAASRFREACEHHAGAGAAPEACYWAGVAEYKRTKEQGPLRETARLLSERYPGNEWTRKASVWSGS